MLSEGWMAIEARRRHHGRHNIRGISKRHHPLAIDEERPDWVELLRWRDPNTSGTV
jgi:hypothetical protein